ncbi:alpha/beta hydrolase [Pseudoroseicyclus aestuarii]|uniref:Lysophospholipase n=1 Tax=Pseudoroseicyclus aestuarii TaxID=1795041 RepID=A0A318SWC4_9RHOB|nr:alpha/beta hydrolase [Pseudoroseicyclus aestuarii]PYE85823.1 lysophospholipase [Pseudoroseicyclus aestuarii]
MPQSAPPGAVAGSPAPRLDDIAPAMAGATTCWARAADGVLLRMAHWRPQGPGRGTVLLFTGRTEYIEKYAALASSLAERGFAVATLDWRGQGLSQRLHPDPSLGHVPSFADYQHDVAALTEHAQAQDLPRPYLLLGHSMGGCIGLRALHQGLTVAAAAFSAPMWGIHMTGGMRILARALSASARAARQHHRPVPGLEAGSYVETAPVQSNMLTTDPQAFAAMQGQLAAHPELALGSPTLAWLGGALAEGRALARIPPPALPCVTVLGGAETIVDPAAIRRRMARWPGGRLVEIPGARHEVLMEAPALRAQAMEAILDLFEAAAPSGPGDAAR